MNSSGSKRPAAPVPLRAGQTGGTFLGFMLGMLFGLAVALGVAVYITKVPLPFMNKNQTRPAADADAVKKDKEWDPNAGLPGRTAKPEGAAAPAVPAEASSPAAPAAPTVPAAPASPAGKSSDPLGELARARAEPPAPAVTGGMPAAPSAEPFQYFVQAGAYRTPEDAEAQRAKLSLMGLQSKVSERDQAGRLVYRVRLGPFERRDEADKAREKLGDNGIEAVVVRLQR